MARGGSRRGPSRQTHRPSCPGLMACGSSFNIAILKASPATRAAAASAPRGHHDASQRRDVPPTRSIMPAQGSALIRICRRAGTSLCASPKATKSSTSPLGSPIVKLIPGSMSRPTLPLSRSACGQGASVVEARRGRRWALLRTRGAQNAPSSHSRKSRRPSARRDSPRWPHP